MGKQCDVFITFSCRVSLEALTHRKGFVFLDWLLTLWSSPPQGMCGRQEPLTAPLAPHIPIMVQSPAGFVSPLAGPDGHLKGDMTCLDPPSLWLWRLFLPRGASCPQWATGHLLRSGLSGTGVRQPHSHISKPRTDASLCEGVYALEGKALAASSKARVVFSDVCALVLRVDTPGACVPCS